MRSRVSFVFLLATASVFATTPPDPWITILSTVHLTHAGDILLPNETAATDPTALEQRVRNGAFAILEGSSPAATQLGFLLTDKRVRIRSIVETREPRLPIIWEQAEEANVFTIPPDAEIFTREKWQKAPLVAGRKLGKGAVLWLAASPGPQGRERFPYLLHALRDLGLAPQVSSRRLWAFFDSSYRLRVDPEYMAKLWRKSGVAALHVASWHFYDEGDEAKEEYLDRLIGACHRNAILVYAWVELPHVSERFWQDHPKWREKTATGADAHLDWRKLMNLRDPDCAQAVHAGLERLLRRFDWDGVNLAELYFESLEGHENPSRFTPMNVAVRMEFREMAGFDPGDLFTESSERHWSRNPDGLRKFLDYRAGLAQRLQQEWIGAIDVLRKDLPHLDLVLTHVDDLLVPETRDRIGAEAKRVLPLLDQHDMTFLVEDPATAWHLGPERYPTIAARYAPLVTKPSRVAIDINVVERYQDVYPTRQQVGLEMLREVHLAAGAFSRVALYFENSLRKTDLPLLPAAAAAVTSITRTDTGGTRYQASAPIGLVWDPGTTALVDGALWPAASEDGTLWLPAGDHVVEPAPMPAPGLRLLDFNGDLDAAWLDGSTLSFSYRSTGRALAILSQPVGELRIDGVRVDQPKLWVFADGWVLVLPRGQHVVSVSPHSGV